MLLKRSKSRAVKMPANKNGKINPIVYTPIKRKPFAPDSALPAIRRTLVNAGPTHGVHAKLNANPIIKAVIGDIVIFQAESEIYVLIRELWNFQILQADTDQIIRLIFPRLWQTASSAHGRNFRPPTRPDRV